VTTRDESLKEAVLARLSEDLRRWGARLGRPPVDTLYLGGGTPSLLTIPELEALTARIRGAFDLGPLREATLEANPGTLEPGWLEAARSLGWGRVSLGVQVLDDGLLADLGRIHDSRAALGALEAARKAGFARISADLLVGIPGQRTDRVLADARTLVEAGAGHLSIYLLDLDKACPLKARIASGRLQAPSEDAVADAFESLQAELPRLGLLPYEISNYARPGEASVHNVRYWERRPYLGFGPSAASQMGSLRWTETGVVSAWAQGRGEPDVEELDGAEALAEVPLLGLRMHRGVDWEALRGLAAERNLLPLVEAWEGRLARFLEAGLLEREGPRLRLTARGMLLSNPVLETFV
jgi:oxygen-independent coproporphyrinogen-3 oxidase